MGLQYWVSTHCVLFSYQIKNIAYCWFFLYIICLVLVTDNTTVYFNFIFFSNYFMQEVYNFSNYFIQEVFSLETN